MAFFKPGWMSRNEEKAIRAVEKLTDQKELFRVVRESENVTICCAAVQRITDQKELIRVVRESENVTIRCAAVQRITDQKELKDIALNEISPEICSLATKNLTDQSALVDVLMNCQRHNYSGSVIKISDQRVIAELAQNAISRPVRQAATFCLSDQNVLEKIASSVSEDVWIRMYAAKKLDNQDLAQSVFIDAAIGVHKEPAAEALQILIKLKNEEVLLEIARSGQMEKIRIEAINNIESRPLIKTLLPSLYGPALHLACGKIGHEWAAPEEVEGRLTEMVNGRELSFPTFLSKCSRCGETKSVSAPNCKHRWDVLRSTAPIGWDTGYYSEKCTLCGKQRRIQYT